MLEVVSVLSLGPRWGALLLCGMHLDGRFYPFYLVRLSGLKNGFLESGAHLGLMFRIKAWDLLPYYIPLVPAKKNLLNKCSWARTPYWSLLHHQVRFWIPRWLLLSCSIKKSMFSALAAAPSRDRHHSLTVWCAHVSAAPCISPGRPAPAPQPQRLPPLFADSAAAPPPPHCSSN